MIFAITLSVELGQTENLACNNYDLNYIRKLRTVTCTHGDLRAKDILFSVMGKE